MRRKKQWIAEWRRRAPDWVSLLIGVILLMDLAHFAAGVQSESRVQEQSRTPALTPRPRRVDATPELHQITAAHVFGLAPAAGADDAALARAARSSLELNGVIATQNPHEGYAILGEKGKAQKLYAIGDAVAEQQYTRLYQVRADRVVLERGGQFEILRLPNAVQSRGTLLAGAAPTAESNVEQSEAAPNPVPPANAAGGFFSSLMAEPRNVDGRPAGMLLHPEKRIQREYGLHDGDILTAINGVAVTDASTLDGLLSDSGRSLVITVTRDGIAQTVNVPINN